MTLLSSSDKPLSIGKLSWSQWEVHTFPDSNFCWRAWMLSLPVNTIRVFLKVMGFVFEKKSATYPSPKNQFVCHPSKWRWCPMNKAASSDWNSSNHMRAFLWDNQVYAYLSYHHTKCRSKKYHPQGSRMFVSKLGFVFLTESTTTAKIWCHCLCLF